MDLNVNETPYSIRQTVMTVPGESYLVSCYIKENKCNQSITTGFIKALGVKEESNFTVSSDVWQEFLYDFIARNNSVIIEIGSSTLASW